MPVLPKREAVQRQREKTMLVLRFLRTSIYSTPEILGQVMGVRDRIAIYRTLKSLEKQGVLAQTNLDAFSTDRVKFTLWGITKAGQEACVFDGEDPNTIVFNPSKISGANLKHYLMLQQIRIAGERGGWTDFNYCDRHARSKEVQKKDVSDKDIRPDLVALAPGAEGTGQKLKVAIEAERVIKSSFRYKEKIIPGHVRNLNAGIYDFLVYVCPTPDQTEHLRQTIKTVYDELRESGKWYLTPSPHGVRRIQFISMEMWPNI